MCFDLLATLLLALGAVAYQVGGLGVAVPLAGGQLMSFTAALFLVTSASGLYEPQNVLSLSRSVARGVFVLLIVLPLAYAIFGLLPAQLSSPEAVQFSVMAGVSALVLRRVVVSQRAAIPRGNTRILIFGAGPAAQVVGATLRSADPNARIVGYMPGPNENEVAVPAADLLMSRGSLTETAVCLGVDEIVVALTERRGGSIPLRQLLDCKLSGIKVCDLNTHFEKTLGQIRIDYLSASWLIFGDGFNQGAFRTFVKRVFDIVCATLLLVLAAPIMAVTALLIKLESAGPVFYRQERVGHFIRRVRIDELPQIFNVLKGEMSLVGPRPERPYFVEQLTQKIPFYAVRHSVKPGVTGWAQVRYAYGATVEDSQEKLQFDLYYVKNHTLFLDLVVLLETVGVVLTGKGAR